MGRIVYVGRMGHIVHIRIYGLYDVDEINGTPSVWVISCILGYMGYMMYVS